jgi:hypothetical protein
MEIPTRLSSLSTISILEATQEILHTITTKCFDDIEQTDGHEDNPDFTESTFDTFVKWCENHYYELAFYALNWEHAESAEPHSLWRGAVMHLQRQMEIVLPGKSPQWYVLLLLLHHIHGNYSILKQRHFVLILFHRLILDQSLPQLELWKCMDLSILQNFNFTQT